MFSLQRHIVYSYRDGTKVFVEIYEIYDTFFCNIKKRLTICSLDVKLIGFSKFILSFAVLNLLDIHFPTCN